MKRIVISQPMFFPWIGLFEQIRLSDVYVHYNDVQFPQGRSFINRVQIKTTSGPAWLTVPIKHGAGLISEAIMDDSSDWRTRHLNLLRQNYAKSSFFDEMIQVVQEAYSLNTTFLWEMNKFLIEAIAHYFDLKPIFLESSNYPTQAKSSEHLLQLMLELEGTHYITGHGARNYLDHDIFDKHGIHVEYMDYRKMPYPQQHGDFTPYVSILDLIANVGKSGREMICSDSIDWREFIL